MSKHTENGLNYLFDFFVWQPFFLAQHLLTYQSLFDVWMIDRCPEFYLWEFEGKLLGEVKVDEELKSLVWAADWSLNQEFPMEQIFFDVGFDSSELV